MMESLGFSLQDILIGAGMEDKEGALKHKEVLARARKAGRALFK